MQSVMINDIVQFRLIEIDSQKIPIFLDEATPYQREEYNGKTVDPLVAATGKLFLYDKKTCWLHSVQSFEKR